MYCAKSRHLRRLRVLEQIVEKRNYRNSGAPSANISDSGQGKANTEWMQTQDGHHPPMTSWANPKVEHEEGTRKMERRIEQKRRGQRESREGQCGR